MTTVSTSCGPSGYSWVPWRSQNSHFCWKSSEHKDKSIPPPCISPSNIPSFSNSPSTHHIVIDPSTNHSVYPASTILFIGQLTIWFIHHLPFCPSIHPPLYLFCPSTHSPLYILSLIPSFYPCTILPIHPSPTLSFILLGFIAIKMVCTFKTSPW